MKSTPEAIPIDAVFRACSDSTRLRLLNLLIPGEACVCELTDVLKIPQPKASRHLAYLRKVGLVESRKSGYWTYYRLTESRSAFQRSLFECLKQGIRAIPAARADLAALKRRKSGGCER